jgi:hypothetical protein
MGRKLSTLPGQVHFDMKLKWVLHDPFSKRV